MLRKTRFAKIAAVAAAAVAACGTLYAFVIQPWHARWGATAKEVALTLPGDDIVPAPEMATTRAITIRATPAEVWSWLVQIGHGRGGMYSYELLENLAGCDLHNAERIHPEWQDLAEGDRVGMGPEGYPFYVVQAIEPERTLILQSGDPATGELAPSSWTFVLAPQPDGTTRLISRQRSAPGGGVGGFIVWRGVVEPISFVMEQKMLRTLRDRAEGT